MKKEFEQEFFIVVGLLFINIYCSNGPSGGIYKTTDAGVSWDNESSGGQYNITLGKSLVGFDLTNESSGDAFMIIYPGKIATLRKTTNSCETWSTQSSDFSSYISSSFKIDFINQQLLKI